MTDPEQQKCATCGHESDWFQHTPHQHCGSNCATAHRFVPPAPAERGSLSEMCKCGEHKSQHCHFSERGDTTCTLIHDHVFKARGPHVIVQPSPALSDGRSVDTRELRRLLEAFLSTRRGSTAALYALKEFMDAGEDTMRAAQPAVESAPGGRSVDTRDDCAKALREIVAWELPRVPCDGRHCTRLLPHDHSYGYTFGSNGERDYFRDIAAAALRAAQPAVDTRDER